MQSHGIEFTQGAKVESLVLKEVPSLPQDTKSGGFVFCQRRLWACVAIEDGLPVWIPMTQEMQYFRHDQQAAAADWSVKHGLNVARPVIQCYDGSGNQIMPSSIKAVSANEVLVSFGGMPRTGVAVVMGGNMFGTPAASYSYEHRFTNANVVIVEHGLGYMPEIAVYIDAEGGGRALILATPEHIDNNSLQITFSSARSGVVLCV